jgi:hypothetical protein
MKLVPPNFAARTAEAATSTTAGRMNGLRNGDYFQCYIENIKKPRIPFSAAIVLPSSIYLRRCLHALHESVGAGLLSPSTVMGVVPDLSRNGGNWSVIQTPDRTGFCKALRQLVRFQRPWIHAAICDRQTSRRKYGTGTVVATRQYYRERLGETELTRLRS